MKRPSRRKVAIIVLAAFSAAGTVGTFLDWFPTACLSHVCTGWSPDSERGKSFWRNGALHAMSVLAIISFALRKELLGLIAARPEHCSTWPIVPWHPSITWMCTIGVYAAFCCVNVPWLVLTASWSCHFVLGQLLIYALSCVATLPCLCKLSDLPNFLGARKPRWKQTFDLTVSGTVLSFVASMVTVPVNRMLWPALQDDALLEQPELATIESFAASGEYGAALLLILIGGVVAPVFEELFFRGFLLTALMQGQPERSVNALLTSSLIFGFFHCSMLQQGVQGLRPLLPTAVLGAVFGIIFLRKRSLIPAILIHQVWNTIHFTLVAVPVSYGANHETVRGMTQWYA